MYKNPIPIEERIEHLPEDIKIKIYKEYFYPKIVAEDLCNKILREVDTFNCVKLQTEYLVPILKDVLKNKLCIEILLKKNSVFQHLYHYIIISKKKNFIHMDAINDFALSWCMMLYH